MGQAFLSLSLLSEALKQLSSWVIFHHIHQFREQGAQVDTSVPNLPVLFPFPLSLPALARSRRAPTAAAPSGCTWVPLWLLPHRFHTPGHSKEFTAPLEGFFSCFWSDHLTLSPGAEEREWVWAQHCPGGCSQGKAWLPAALLGHHGATFPLHPTWPEHSWLPQPDTSTSLALRRWGGIQDRAPRSRVPLSASPSPYF